MINEIEKTFFNPGDVVTLKHGELTSPVMYVVEKITQSLKVLNVDDLIRIWFYVKQYSQQKI